MDALELFLRQHATVHSTQVAEGEPREPEASAREGIQTQGALRPEAEWLLRFWEGKSKSYFLSWMGVGHNQLHLRQARWVRKLLLGKGQT